MSDTIPQSVSNGCRKYVKSRIIINTFNTFNNVNIEYLMGLGHTPVEQFCYNLPHQPTLSGSSLSGHHLDDSVAREGHDAVEIEFPFYPIFEMVSLPIVQPRYSFQPFVHSSNVFAKIAIKNQIHLKSHCKLREKSNVFEKIRVHSAMIQGAVFLQ